jgi:predicted transposase YdaD
MSKDDIRKLFRLLDWILDLPDELQEQFREDVHHYEQEKSMPYLSSLERMALEEGRKKGREEGREEGLKAGRDGVAVALEAKFGRPGRKLLARVRRINDIAELRRLAKIIKTAKTADDVQRQLN